VRRELATALDAAIRAFADEIVDMTLLATLEQLRAAAPRGAGVEQPPTQPSAPVRKPTRKAKRSPAKRAPAIEVVEIPRPVAVEGAPSAPAIMSPPPWTSGSIRGDRARGRRSSCSSTCRHRGGLVKATFATSTWSSACSAFSGGPSDHAA
jgi:hypothetical protein